MKQYNYFKLSVKLVNHQGRTVTLPSNYAMDGPTVSGTDRATG